MVHVELSLARGVHRELPHDRAHVQFENRSRTTRSRFHKSVVFPENEGNFGGNQILFGSIRPSPPCRRRTICPSISKRAFARDSPDFAFFKHFPGFFRALLLLKPLSRSRSVAGVCLCVCVWNCVLCMLCAVLCYICSTNMRKSTNMENKTGSNHGHNVVRKCKKKHKKHWEHIKNMVSLFGHDMAIHGPKKGPKTAIFPDALFLRFPWDLPKFSAEGPIPNAQKTQFLTRGPNPKVLIMR